MLKQTNSKLPEWLQPFLKITWLWKPVLFQNQPILMRSTKFANKSGPMSSENVWRYSLPQIELAKQDLLWILKFQ